MNPNISTNANINYIVLYIKFIDLPNSFSAFQVVYNELTIDCLNLSQHLESLLSSKSSKIII